MCDTIKTPELSVPDFQRLIRDMYVEKDKERGHVVIHDLALAAAALHRALRGVGLEQGAVMMDMVKGDKSCLQEKASFPVCYLISGP